MIFWSDPAYPQEDIQITITASNGWHEALVHFPNDVVLDKAKRILKEQGYSPPRDRWHWEKKEITYMRTTDTLYSLKLRHSPQGDEEE